ncbi:hypothetical protein H1R20_g10664, partial [Candolleomyces eurysporus]
MHAFGRTAFYTLVYSREECERKSKELACSADQLKAQLEYIKQEKKKVAGRGKTGEPGFATAKYKDAVTGHNVRVEAKVSGTWTLIYDTPPTQDVTQACILAHLDQIPEIVKNWLENVISILLDLLSQEQESGRKTKGGKGTSKKVPAELSELLLFPHVVLHERLSSKHGKVPEEEQWDPNCWWIKCHDSQLEFDEAASECASAIINVLGKDPKTTTWKELDEDNQRVECLTCRKNKRLAMDWRHAILHELAKHLDEDDDTRVTRWKCLIPSRWHRRIH